MTLEIAAVLVIVLAAVVLFATEKLRVDMVALLVTAALLLCGLLRPEDGIAGFANPATVTVAAMFVLSAGLLRSGVLEAVSRHAGDLFARSPSLGTLAMMGAAGVLSAFINNTPVVAIFIPVILSATSRTGVNAARVLMPVSFASIFGGICTLIGTSTNILVSIIAERHGLEPFSMFEFSRLGLVLFVIGTLYMVFFGIRRIPKRHADVPLTTRYGMGRYLTEVVLLPDADSVGHTIAECPLVRRLNLEVLEIQRAGVRHTLPDPDQVLEAGDHLRVIGDVDKIRRLQKRQGVRLLPTIGLSDEELEAKNVRLIEAVVAPGSPLDGGTLKSIQFRTLYGATVLALRHRGALVHQRVEEIRLQAGDVLLMEAHQERLAALQLNPAFMLVSELTLPVFRREKAPWVMLIAAGVVGTAALGWLPIMVSAVAGAVLLVLTGCLTLEEAYRAIDAKVIVLLAGALSMGAALEGTGAAGLLAHLLVEGAGQWGPVAVMAALFLLTTILTSVISNNATAVLLAPIAISAAAGMQVDPRPLLMAVTFAASTCFMTPVGYQTNTMIYSVGGYRFTDFLRVGTPLNLLFWGVCVVLIPLLWPFTPR